MHIVHVLTRLARGGSEENVMATCAWQQSAGHVVTVVHGGDAAPYWRKTTHAKIDLISVPDLVQPISARADWAAKSTLQDIYAALYPDVIHTHQSKAGILGRRAAWVVPHALVVHGIHIVNFDHVPMLRRRLYITAERSVASMTDAFIGVSDAMCSAYVNAGIARQRKMHCVPSGFDLARFRLARPPSDAKTLLGRTPPKFTIAMLAAMEPRKGHLAFLSQVANVASKMPEARLLLCGDGPLRPHIENHVAALGLSKTVHICGHRDDPEAILAIADVSVLSSSREGIPRAALQSLAAGKPVVMPSYPGVDVAFRNEKNAILVSRSDPRALAVALRDLYHDPIKLGGLKNGAEQTDLTAWTEARLGRDTTAVYRHAIAQRSRAA